MADKKDYEVGYGKPPKSTQFQKGQSGNPKGRPKKKRMRFLEDVTGAFMNLANEEIQVNTSMGAKLVSSYEAVLMAVLNNALKGNHRSQKLFLETSHKAAKNEKIYFEEMQQAMHDLAENVSKYSSKEFYKRFGIPSWMATEMHKSLSQDLENRFPLE